MRVDIVQLADGEEIMAGAEDGRRLLGRLIESAPRPIRPELVFLDFKRVRVATGSFLRELVLAFRDYCRRNATNLSPVLANANEQVLEELSDLLRVCGDALATCTLDIDGRPSAARVLGHLEKMQRLALDAVIVAGVTDAPSLSKTASEPSEPGSTKWNNRLAALASKGLVVEMVEGRTKRYRPVLEGLTYGT